MIGISSFDEHVDHCCIVFKSESMNAVNGRRNVLLRMVNGMSNVANSNWVAQNENEIDEGCALRLEAQGRQQHIQQHTSIHKPTPREMMSAPVLLWEEKMQQLPLSASTQVPSLDGIRGPAFCNVHLVLREKRWNFDCRAMAALLKHTDKRLYHHDVNKNNAALVWGPNAANCKRDLCDVLWGLCEAHTVGDTPSNNQDENHGSMRPWCHVPTLSMPKTFASSVHKCV